MVQYVSFKIQFNPRCMYSYIYKTNTEFEKESYNTAKVQFTISMNKNNNKSSKYTVVSIFGEQN